MNQQDLDTTGRAYRRADGLAIRSVGEDTLLMPVRSSGSGLDNIFVLNETGSLIWRVLATPSRRKAIAEALSVEFAVEREQAEADVAAYLEVLSKAKLIEMV